jgi:hypothetical protein
MCGRHQYLYFHGEATRKFANKLKASSDHWQGLSWPRITQNTKFSKE